MNAVADFEALESELAEAIARSLEESAEDAILGFIDVDETTQQHILHALRLENLLGSIRGMLHHYPCVTTYGLAVAAPIGMKDDDVFSGGFYNAWQAAFGYTPDHSDRERLGLAFNKALEGIGMQTGTITPGKPIHHKGGCYLYQSGILPHFIQPLRQALNGAMKRRPLPDPDDEEQCDGFARLLAGIVHPAQVRLRRVLQSQIGGFLVRRLVRWHLTGDDQLFPAHVRELLAEQKGKAVFANSPYLCFDEARGEIQLVLPAQNAKLADSNTRWTIPGMPPFRATIEKPPIPLSEVASGGSEFVALLSHLRGDLENIEFKLRHGLSDAAPFLIFDRTRNREVRVSLTGDEIRLRPGVEYLIVIARDVEVVSDHEVEEIGDSRFIRYTTTPGSEPPAIRRGDHIWSIKPAIKAGLYLARDEATLLHVTSAADPRPIMVSYGKGFQLTCCLPADVQADQVVFSSPFSSKLTQVVPLPQGYEQSGLRMMDLSGPLMDWLDGLPDAILRIEVKVPLPTRNLTTDWIFWKGLDRITIYGDIRWSSTPANLKGHPGFRATAHGLDRERRERGYAELHVAALGTTEIERWSLPSNKVQVALVQDDGSIEPIGTGEQIDLLSSDKRVFQFNSGGLMPVRLTANGKELGIVSPDRPTICCYPSVLLVECGRAATVRAETLLPVPGENTWPLVSWQSPLSAKECRVPEVAGEKMVWKVRRINLAGITALRVSLRKIDPSHRGEQQALTAEIPLSQDPEVSEPLTPIPGLEIGQVPKSKGMDLHLTFEREVQKGAVWCVDLEGRSDEGSEWQTLVVPEKFGRLAQVRFLMIGDDPADGSAFRNLFWGEIRDDVLETHAGVELGAGEIEGAIAEVSSLLAWKYPTPVWQQNAKRLKGVCAMIASAASRNGLDGRSAWWTWTIESLARHSKESQPVVIPELPILHGFETAATSLRGCRFPDTVIDSLVERCFREAGEFENRDGNGCLAYLNGAIGEGRIDPNAVCWFGGFQQLSFGHDVPLGKPKLRDWMRHVSDGFNSRESGIGDEGAALLSVEHFARCLARTTRRCHVLTSIASAEYGQWLSGPISRLQTHQDAVEGALHDLLGPMLQSTPVELLWKPMTDILTAEGDHHTAQLVRTLVAGNILLALTLRKHASGARNWSETVAQMRKIVGGDNSRSRLHDQAGLMIGTSPEFFALYFLLFTLAS